MAGPDLDTPSALMDDAKCFALVRQHRWPDGAATGDYYGEKAGTP